MTNNIKIDDKEGHFKFRNIITVLHLIVIRKSLNLLSSLEDLNLSVIPCSCCGELSLGHVYNGKSIIPDRDTHHTVSWRLYCEMYGICGKYPALVEHS